MTNIFIEANREGYPISIFDKSELNFINSKNLISINGDRFQPLFVGEFITPNNSYFSLPKNFEATQENVELFRKVLTNYKDLKGDDGKTLLSNNTFSVSNSGQIESEKFYFNELKEFFLDYITYEYIYPQKSKKVHSTSPIANSKIDVFTTMKNRKYKGPGITYKMKDIKNTEEWNLDDIYWTTISDLCDKYGTSDDFDQIKEMKEFLENLGYELKKIDISDKNKTILDINKCDVGIIHKPIKNILIDYYNSVLISEKYTINLFYTSKFQYVWEELVRNCLKHSEKFKNELKSIMTMPVRRRFETGDLKENYRDLIPDLFSEYNGKKFIGDAKYYNDPSNAHFDKEMYVYNQLIDNKYPMCVFVPSAITRRLDVREQANFELIVFKISVKDAISDVINKTNIVIDKIQLLISKNTKREF